MIERTQAKREQKRKERSLTSGLNEHDVCKTPTDQSTDWFTAGGVEVVTGITLNAKNGKRYTAWYAHRKKVRYLLHVHAYVCVHLIHVKFAGGGGVGGVHVVTVTCFFRNHNQVSLLGWPQALTDRYHTVSVTKTSVSGSIIMQAPVAEDVSVLEDRQSDTSQCAVAHGNKLSNNNNNKTITIGFIRPSEKLKLSFDRTTKNIISQ